MIKMCGAALILMASILVSGRLMKEKQDRYRLLADLKESLRYLNREIGERGVTLKECFGALTQGTAGKSTRGFFGAVEVALSTLGEMPFSAIWQEGIQQHLYLLTDQEKEMLLPLGQALGRCDAAKLCEALDETVRAIEEEIAAIKSGEGNYRRVAVGIPLSLGAIAVIMLM